MGSKTLCTIDGSDGQKYRVTKWNDPHATRVADIGRPAKLYERDVDGGWAHLATFDAGERLSRTCWVLRDDRDVLEEALRRLDLSFGVTADRIVYDRYNDTKIDGIDSYVL